jgi:3',5'-cyclic-AMP phosphodiesterase
MNSRGRPVPIRAVIRLAHLSDTHLVADADGFVGGYESAANLESVVEAFPTRPDVAVVTGDVAEDGSAGAYRTARSITSRLAGEVHYVGGNHDDPAAMGAVLDAGDDLRVVELSPNWRMALVSSAWEDHGEGRVKPDTLVGLDDALATTSKNVLVCLHHPPLSTCGYAYCRIDNEREVRSLLTERPQVRAALSGHLHRRFDVLHDGVRFIGAPSTCRQLRHGGTQAHFMSTPAPPAAGLLELHDDGTIVNHHVSTGRRQHGAYWRLLSKPFRRLTRR